MADTVDTLPMSILSGQYQQSNYKGTPINDVVSAYRERQPGRDVAAARQAVGDLDTQNRKELNQAAYSKASGAEDVQLEQQISELDSQISNLDQWIKEAEATEAQDKLESQGLQDIIGNKRGTTDVTLPVTSGSATPGTLSIEEGK